VWRDEHEWPLARARPTRLFLHSNGSANTRLDEGKLNAESPGEEPTDHYLYDPKNSVKSYGGHGCCSRGLTPNSPLDQI
jgi:predicted acyl esterase